MGTRNQKASITLSSNNDPVKTVRTQLVEYRTNVKYEKEPPLKTAPSQKKVTPTLSKLKRL